LEQEKKTFIDRIWDFFASVRLAIIVFALISATSIIGTVLDQRADPAKNLQILSRLFGESLAPSLYNISNALGFINMYHSWWFISLLVLFAVNLVICSLDRLPKIWKLVQEPIAPLAEEKIRKFLINREIVLKGTPDRLKDAVQEAIKGVGLRCQEEKEEKGYQFYAQRGNYTRLGVYITHFSILFILIGAIIGMQFGFKGFMEIPEGTETNVVFSDNDHEKQLDFSIRCDNFNMEFYGMSDMPKEYKSWLAIVKDGKEVMKKAITVNDPLTYEGITFYQSSYGLIPNGLNRGIFIFKVISKDGQSSLLNLRLGESFQIPGTGISGKIADFSPALQFNNTGQALTYADQMNNPAVFIDFSEAGRHKFSGWILKRHPESWQLPDGSRVEFYNYWGVEFTGLQVRKDPGVWVVYLGCLMMSIGLFIALFTSHRRIWVKMVGDKSNTRVIVGASANKNRASLERRIDRMISILDKKQGGEK
jgi:cytochrome c biogenesis protein